MNIQIPNLRVDLLEKYLYNCDSSFSGIVPAVVVGASSYVGQAITFHLMVENKWLFSDLPITSFKSVGKIGKENNLQDSSSILCETDALECFSLGNYPCVSVLIGHEKEGRRWATGKYHMSFDFPSGNQNVHLLELISGDFVLAPNYRINWKNEESLPDYKKNRHNWRW